MRYQFAISAAIAAGLSAIASASVLTPGFYRLHNHPDGNQSPPPYGLRLDELFNATSGHDVFTFDFDHPSSNVILNYTGSTIHISGQAFGGRDNGSSYFNDQYKGLYSFSFDYTVGLTQVPGDDDLYTPVASSSNFGSITGPIGGVAQTTFALADQSDGNYTFRVGNENNDLGHRGFNGLSGWGWLNINGHHVDSQDWLFTLERTIPTPGAAGVLTLGALALGRRRR